MIYIVTLVYIKLKQSFVKNVDKVIEKPVEVVKIVEVDKYIEKPVEVVKIVEILRRRRRVRTCIPQRLERRVR